MMSPTSELLHGLLEELDAAGLRIWVTGQRLAVSPRDRLTPGLATRIRAHRDALVAALDGDSPVDALAVEYVDPDAVPVCSACGSQDAWQTLAGRWRCGICDPPTTARRIRQLAAQLRPAVETRPEPNVQDAETVPESTERQLAGPRAPALSACVRQPS